MAEETELGRWYTAFVRGATSSKMGTAVITSDRLLFFDQKFAPNAAAGVLTSLIVDRLQKRHEEGGPLLDLPFSVVTSVTRRKKLLNKDRMAIGTSDGEHLLNDGWSKWSPILRGALADSGRTIVDESEDAFRVE